MFQDVHVMIFIGFGFLMTFLRRHGFTAVGVNFLLAATAVQWAILCLGFFHRTWSSSGYELASQWTRISLSVSTLINADFCAGAVLISFGAVIGKVWVADGVYLLLFCISFSL